MTKLCLCLLILVCVKARAQESRNEAGVCVDGKCQKTGGIDEIIDAEKDAKAMNAILKQRRWIKGDLKPDELAPDEGVVKLHPEKRDKKVLRIDDGSDRESSKDPSADASKLKGLSDGVSLGNTHIKPSRRGIKVKYENTF